jgi:hypothetical protein
VHFTVSSPTSETLVVTELCPGDMTLSAAVCWVGVAVAVAAAVAALLNWAAAGAELAADLRARLVLAGAASKESPWNDSLRYWRTWLFCFWMTW